MATTEGLYTYRAEFRQPKGHMNPMNMKVPGAVLVEVFAVGKTGTRWKARAISNEGKPGKVFTYEDKSDLVGTTAEHCQRLVASYFEEQLNDWTPRGEGGH